MELSQLAVVGAGGIWVVEGDRDGITEVHMPRGNVRASSVTPSAPVRAAAKQLEQYFAGKRTEFDVELHVAATDFQVDVWGAVMNIPFGAVATYQDSAYAVGRPRAYRAVGNANGRNPFPIFVPCHRVVAESGLGGYGGGLHVKRALLALEGITDYD